SDERASKDRRLDIPGAVAIFFTLSTMVLAVNRGQAWGWMSPPILALFAVAACSLAAFVRIESRTPSPIVALPLFRIRTFTLSVLSLILNFAGQSAVTFL